MTYTLAKWSRKRSTWEKRRYMASPVYSTTQLAMSRPPGVKCARAQAMPSSLAKNGTASRPTKTSLMMAS